LRALRLPTAVPESIGMEIKLLSHINGDGDLLGAWFRHYRALGVSSFHLIVHGPRDENEVLYEVKKKYPVVIEDAYQGQFSSEEKKGTVERGTGADEGELDRRGRQRRIRGIPVSQH